MESITQLVEINNKNENYFTNEEENFEEENEEEKNKILNSPEADCIIRYSKEKMNKKKGVIHLFTGETGDGKSYAGLRLLEIWYNQWFKQDFPKTHIVENLAQAILLVKDFKEAGEGILIEELSVLASSRDSLTKQNKLWNKFLDTVRIKQAFIVGNLPHISFLDKHFIMMCNTWINCTGVDFQRNIVIARPLWLQTSPHKNEPYKHKFLDKEGEEINFCYFKKLQNIDVQRYYDDLKINSITELHKELVEGLLKDLEKKSGLKGGFDFPRKPLTELQEKILKCWEEGTLKQKDIGKIVGKTQSQIANNEKYMRNKGYYKEKYRNNTIG